jgi:hypothetical protein
VLEEAAMRALDNVEISSIQDIVPGFCSVIFAAERALRSVEEVDAEVHKASRMLVTNALTNRGGSWPVYLAKRRNRLGPSPLQQRISIPAALGEQ